MNRLEWECPRAGTTFSNRAVNIRLFLRSDAIRGGIRSLISFHRMKVETVDCEIAISVSQVEIF
jgi:hypothetical protein